MNSLRCMTSDVGSILTTAKCTFDLNINEPIPDDSKLTAPASKCAIHEADTVSLFGHSDGSCYAGISIDYSTKKMNVKLNHVSVLLSTLSPYDDMFGFANGIQSIVQYKIKGNLEQGTLKMTTRIQCQTYDNCALDKLRKLLPNLTISDTRLNIFKEVIKFLNAPGSHQALDLACKDDGEDDVECQNGEDRCKFDHAKDAPISKGCTTEDPTAPYDLEYRFNVIENMTNFGTDNSAKAFKSSYVCKTDYCNSDNQFQKLDILLNSLALASSAPIPSKNNRTPNPNNAPPAAHASNNNVSKKPKSDGVSFMTSYYYRSIIIFSLLIQILWN